MSYVGNEGRSTRVVASATVKENNEVSNPAASPDVREARRASLSDVTTASLGHTPTSSPGSRRQKLEMQAKKYEELAKQGDPAAQHRLGMCYLFGKGVVHDPTKAFEWFKSAANQRLGEAQAMLALCYWNGKGVQKDSKQALYWAEKAANQEQPIGEYVMALLYRTGSGVKKDAKLAFEWAQRAAGRGHMEAQSLLSEMYLAGEGVGQSREAATRWMAKAAEQMQAVANSQTITTSTASRTSGKNPMAATKNAAPKSSEEVPPRTSATSADETSSISAIFGMPVGELEERAKRGDPEAQDALGMCYLAGWGVVKDPIKANSLFKLAADQGHREAQYRLAVSYMFGQGVPPDPEKAMSNFKLAADQGNFDGPCQPAEWTQRAFVHLNQSLVDAHSRLLSQLEGEGVEQDILTLKKAAEQKQPEALYQLGVHCIEGKLVPKDDALGCLLIKEAASLGLNVAKEWVRNRATDI